MGTSLRATCVAVHTQMRTLIKHTTTDGGEGGVAEYSAGVLSMNKAKAG